MFKKNGIVTGLAAGIVFPLITWVCFDVIYKGVVLMQKPALPYFIAIGLNLVMLRYTVKKGWHKAGQGVMIVTFIFTLLIFIMKVKI